MLIVKLEYSKISIQDTLFSYNFFFLEITLLTPSLSIGLAKTGQTRGNYKYLKRYFSSH